MILKNLMDALIEALGEIAIIKHVDQDRGQLQNLAGITAFRTPAVLIRPEVTASREYLAGSQFIEVNLVITLISKDFTRAGETNYTFYDVANEVYKKLNGNHFNGLCVPLRRTNITADFNWKDFNFGTLEFVTNIDDRTLSNSQQTISATPSVVVNTYISSTASQVTDIYPYLN